MARACRSGAGGIRGLIAELNTHGEAIDADLQREYGLSVADVVTGRVSLRRLGGLLRGLPVDGTAMWRAARRERPSGAVRVVDPPAEWWSAERDLLAAILDRLSILVWQPTEDGRHGRNPPQPTRRPAVDARAPKRGDSGVRVAKLLRMAGRDTTAA